MKTLLEFLEENRSILKDGIYSVTGIGHLCIDGKYLIHEKINPTKEKYALFGGVITIITAWSPIECGVHYDNQSGEKENKYNRQCKGVIIDVYDVLAAFPVTNPALQHLIKKALCAGLRGHKDTEQDLQDIIDSAVRALELYHDDNRSAE